MTGEDREVAGTAARLAEFARMLTDEHEVEDILRGLVDYCTQLLPIGGAGVLLRDANDELRFATANSDVGREVEELEVELGEGPCTDALDEGRRVLVADLRDARERYPRFAPAALELGVRSVHGVPMSVRGGAVGVLDLICTEVVDLQPAEAISAQLLADVAVSYIENSRLLESQSVLAQQLQDALHSRIAIEQAKGILAERYGIAFDEAFERLRRAARSRQQTVRHLASQVVKGEADV